MHKAAAYWYSLRAFIVRFARVFQVASVFNGDFVANLGDGAIAFLKDSLGDAHGC